MAALPELGEFGLQAARGTLWRLDRAFAGFFRRVAAGQTPGYPRFQSRDRFDSVSYPEPRGWKLTPRPGRVGRLRVQGVGHVKIRLHRPLEGEARTLTVRRQGRRWWATIQCRNIPARRLPPTGRSTGVDRGVAVAAACADGTLHANPRYLAATADRLAAAQQALAKTRRRPPSKRRRRAKAEVARLHHRVANQRKDSLHKLSRLLVDSYDTIALEDLRIPNMVRSAPGTLDAPGVNVAAKAGLNRSILDVGWGQFGGHDRLQSGRSW
jgi:putative transposase